jgi:hypothetical protein
VNTVGGDRGKSNKQHTVRATTQCKQAIFFLSRMKDDSNLDTVGNGMNSIGMNSISFATKSRQ